MSVRGRRRSRMPDGTFSGQCFMTATTPRMTPRARAARRTTSPCGSSSGRSRNAPPDSSRRACSFELSRLLYWSTCVRTPNGERFASLYEGVVSKIFDVLPDETWVYPGHGKDTTLGDERPHLEEWRERGWKGVLGPHWSTGTAGLRVRSGITDLRGAAFCRDRWARGSPVSRQRE
jgi:hypothetical protein